jgi:putative endonuclease
MYYVYILKCKDGTLYCGSTNDLKKRAELHNSGRGSKYVHSRGGGTIVYTEKLQNKSASLKREFEIKKWSRSKKLTLIKRIR